MKALARLFLVPALLGLLSVTSFAFEVPALQARVNDYANLLTPDQRTALEETLRTLEEKTTAQVVILTVPDLQGEAIASFAVKVFENWKLGQKGKDNGILLTYSLDGDHFRIEVGYGLEGAVTDVVSSRIIREQFRSKAPKDGHKDFNAAFTVSVEKISEIIYKEYAHDPSGASMKKHYEDSQENGAIVFFVIAVIIAGVFGFASPLLGATVGAIEGLIAGLFFSMGPVGIIILVVVGFFIGLFASAILQGMANSGGSYSSGDTSWISSSSSDGDSGGFSGGGGSSGGGGADD